MQSDDYLSSHESLMAHFCMHSYVSKERLPALGVQDLETCYGAASVSLLSPDYSLKPCIEFDSLHTALDVFTHLFPAPFEWGLTSLKRECVSVCVQD